MKDKFIFFKQNETLV